VTFGVTSMICQIDNIRGLLDVQGFECVYDSKNECVHKRPLMPFYVQPASNQPFSTQQPGSYGSGGGGGGGASAGYHPQNAPPGGAGGVPNMMGGRPPAPSAPSSSTVIVGPGGYSPAPGTGRGVNPGAGMMMNAGGPMNVVGGNVPTGMSHLQRGVVTGGGVITSNPSVMNMQFPGNPAAAANALANHQQQQLMAGRPMPPTPNMTGRPVVRGPMGVPVGQPGMMNPNASHQGVQITGPRPPPQMNPQLGGQMGAPIPMQSPNMQQMSSGGVGPTASMQSPQMMNAQHGMPVNSQGLGQNASGVQGGIPVQNNPTGTPQRMALRQQGRPGSFFFFLLFFLSFIHLLLSFL